MAGLFPTLEDGQICRYPVDAKSAWVTRVNQFVDFTEQRWVVRQPLQSFVFKYNHVSRADTNVIREFFRTQKGMFDGFTVVFDGFEYQNMYFDQDEFMPVEEDKWPNRFTFSLKLKQARPNGWFWISDNPDEQDLPFIAGGVTTQTPWTSGETFFTSKIDLETGSRYSYNWIAKEGEATEEPLRRWEINYAHITHDEAVVLFVFFHQMHGRLRPFRMHDPDLYVQSRQAPFSPESPDPNYKVFPNCRFDMDEINLNYLGPNEYSTKLLIAEFNLII